MSKLLFKIELQTVSGLAQDKVVNTLAADFGFDAEESDATGAAYVLFNALFNDVPTGGLAAMKDFIAPQIVRGANVHAIKVYDIEGHLDGTPTGSPIGTLLMPMAAQGAASAGMPGEVAFAVTLEATGRAAQPVEVPDGADADALVDRPRQRYTGRFYYGPLSINGASADADGCRPGANLRDTARLAMKAAWHALDDFGTGMTLSVWSRKDGILRPVDAVSTDNAFDTIRSRGPRATARTRLAV